MSSFVFDDVDDEEDDGAAVVLRLGRRDDEIDGGHRLQLEAYVRGEQEPQVFPITLSIVELKRRSAEIIKTLSTTDYSEDIFARDRYKQADLVDHVALLGWGLFSRMFSASDRNRLLGLLDELEEGAPVLVREQHLTVPWNLLYPEPVASSADPLRFLGARWLFASILEERSNNLSSRAELGIDVTLPRGALPGIGLVHDRELSEEQWKREEDVLRRQCPTGVFRPMPTALGAEPRDDDLKTYAKYLAGRWLGMHFGVHAVMPYDDPTEYRMRVTDKFEHLLREVVKAVRKDHGGFRSFRFAFMNSCQSAALTDLIEANAITVLHRNGVDALVGVQSAIWDSCAGPFAEAFYEEALGSAEERNVGQALFRARRTRLDASPNPAVLLYVLYGRPDTHIRPAL
ncbi:hypothetical protein [Azospirillum picis]|uniref:CHAT domain-containing protein n=1 Tax=Azospirillum picis TaxID=488438 RepID=A0ABU0MQM9_9PROT|nr:hypothetical protein [Azospirillum picis]MBP2302203.1 hypothetical protein [Azospirillum picis]MDQ0535782.1 hypothetical protein [Azospirillum picis]